MIKGVNRHRLSSNPMEKRLSEYFSLAFKKYNLSNIFKTQRQQQVAASLVQWLGSPVGQVLLSKSLGRSGIDALHYRSKNPSWFISMPDAWPEYEATTYMSMLSRIMDPNPSITTKILEYGDDDAAIDTMKWLDSSEGWSFLKEALDIEDLKQLSQYID